MARRNGRGVHLARVRNVSQPLQIGARRQVHTSTNDLSLNHLRVVVDSVGQNLIHVVLGPSFDAAHEMVE
jgi:hypothetical protein